MLPIEIKAYIAGLFDGEGYIRLLKKQRKYGRNKRGSFLLTNYFYYDLIAAIGNTNLNCLLFVKANYGGSITKQKRAANHKQSYTLALYSRTAATFLQDMQPYSIVKREQIELALQFRATKDKELRDTYICRLKILNHRGYFTSQIPLA